MHAISGFAGFFGFGFGGVDLRTSLMGENMPRLVSFGESAWGGSSYVSVGGLKFRAGAASSVVIAGCSGWTIRIEPIDSETVGDARLGSGINAFWDAFWDSAVFGLGPTASFWMLDDLGDTFAGGGFWSLLVCLCGCGADLAACAS